MAGSAIWTPQGVVPLDGTSVDTIHLRPSMMEWFRQFHDFARSQNIGIHCANCGADIVGKCSDSDARFSATCGCRVWTGENRDYLKPMKW